MPIDLSCPIFGHLVRIPAKPHRSSSMITQAPLSEARRTVSPSMGESDVTFRRLLRQLPRPLLRLAFPRRRLEPLGPLDPSVDRSRQRTADNLFRVRDGATEAAVHVEIEREWRPT